MLRKTLEKLSRRVVLKKRLPAKYGRTTVYVSPDACLQFWIPGENVWRGFVDELFAFADEFVPVGGTVWDIGTNMAVFALAAAAKAGKTGSVLAVEGDLFSVALSTRSASKAPKESAPVRVLHAAISDSHGIAEFVIVNRGRSMSHLAGISNTTEKQSGGVRDTQTVLTVTLDWLAEQGPPPVAIKVDVEGAEALVLRGATMVLAKHRPTFLCEISEERADECTEIFHRHHYKLYDFVSRELVQRATWSTLAVPDKS